MLQKLPLVLCSCQFFSLNVSRNVFRCVCNGTNNIPPTPPFIFAYMQRPLALEHLTLLEAAHSWYLSANRRRKNPWKQNLHHKIVRVYPQFLSIPAFDSSSFEPFCWSKLILYKDLRSIPRDIGTTASEIISHWKQIKGTYTIWHVEHAQE